MYRDLREFISLVEQMGLLRQVEGADAYLEIGGITEVAAARPESPMLLFDSISGYPRGFRVLTNATFNIRMAALALGLDPTSLRLRRSRRGRSRADHINPIPPSIVKSAAFLENTMRGPDIDLDRFPIPHWRERDGGPYLGTSALIVTRESCTTSGPTPPSIGCRSTARTVSRFSSITAAGMDFMIAQKYWESGKPCPIAIAVRRRSCPVFCGDRAGAGGQDRIRNRRGMEGHADRGVPGAGNREFGACVLRDRSRRAALLPPGQTLMEGPIGEFTGYYAGDRSLARSSN